MFDDETRAIAEELMRVCREKSLMVATAESCTGGLIGGLLTSVPGSSAVFERGFITYSNEAKSESIGVPAETIAAHGAVSKEVARAMAEGAVRNSRAALAVSVTGIAGPDGGTAEKPVGLVYIGCYADGGEATADRHHFGGNRDEIRMLTVRAAVALLVSRARTC